MTDLMPLTALGGTTARSASFGDLTLTENTDLGLASLAIGQGQAQPKPFGLELPEPGKVSSNADITAFWTGPGQWMIQAHGKAEVDFSRDVSAEAPGLPVTDQTDGFVCFDITGPATSLQRLLPKLVNIDPKTIIAGSACRTGFEHMTVFVIRHSDEKLSILGMRSLASNIWHAISVPATRLAAE